MPWGDSGGGPSEDPGDSPSFAGLRMELARVEIPWTWEGEDFWLCPRPSEQLPYLGHPFADPPPASPDPQIVDWDAAIGDADFVAFWYHVQGPTITDRAGLGITIYPLAFPGFTPTFDFPYGDPNYGPSGFRYGRLLLDVDPDTPPVVPWTRVADFEWATVGYGNQGFPQTSFFGYPYDARHAYAWPFSSTIFGDTAWIKSPGPPSEFADDPASIILWDPADLRAANPALRWITTVGFVDAELVNNGTTLADARDGTKIWVADPDFYNGTTLFVARYYFREGVLTVGDAVGGIRRRKRVIGSPSEPVTIVGE